MCDQIAKLAIGGQEGACDRTRFTILTKVRSTCNQGFLRIGDKVVVFPQWGSSGYADIQSVQCATSSLSQLIRFCELRRVETKAKIPQVAKVLFIGRFVPEFTVSVAVYVVHTERESRSFALDTRATNSSSGGSTVLS